MLIPTVYAVRIAHQPDRSPAIVAPRSYQRQVPSVEGALGRAAEAGQPDESTRQNMKLEEQPARHEIRIWSATSCQSDSINLSPCCTVHEEVARQ
jgi:hypothetical protein